MVVYPLLLPVSPRNHARRIDGIIATLATAYTRRCRCLVAAIADYLPDGTDVWGGRGGFFVWIGLPAGTDARQVVALAAAHEGVLVAGGDSSECPGAGNVMGWGRRWIRLSVSYCDENELVEGVRRLGRAVERWRDGERVGPVGGGGGGGGDGCGDGRDGDGGRDGNGGCDQEHGGDGDGDGFLLGKPKVEDKLD